MIASSLHQMKADSLASSLYQMKTISTVLESCEFGLFRWNGLGFSAPANIPTYIVLGSLVPREEAAMLANRSFISNSNSIELDIVMMTN